MLTDPEFQTTDDNLLTFYGSQNTTLKALLADKMTIEDLQEAVTALDLPAKNNPEFTGVLKINNVDVESKIDSKLNATDPTKNATSDDLIMFTGLNNTSLKTLLSAKLNATALDNTVVNTNSLSDPVIVGSLNYKETSSDTDSRNLISEISNKANLSSPNFQTSLQLNSTNVLLQPGDFTGSLQSYIELKAPEQTPPDLSGLVSKPGDYNGDLQSYIELKAPEQTPPDLSGLVSKPGDYNGGLQSYIELKAPEQTPPDLSGLVSKPGDYNGDLQSYIELKAREQTPPDLSGLVSKPGSSYPSKWAIDSNAGGLSVFPTTANMQTLYWYNESGDTLIFSFDNVFYVPPPPPDLVMRIEPTGGSWQGVFDYYYFGTTSDDRYLYVLVLEGSTNRHDGYDKWDVQYDVSDGKWYDVGFDDPSRWGIDDAGTDTTAFNEHPTAANMQTHYFYDPEDNLKFQFDNPYYIAPPAPEPGYKYLGFYGRSGTSNGWFYELELSTTDGVIDYTNPIPLNKITVVGTPLGSEYNNPSCIFDGQYTQPGSETLIFDPNEIGALFYMENESNKQVENGSYYTYDSQGSSAVLSGAIYGTNTDPTTFDATDESNWDYVCDLTVISETPEPPPDPVERIVLNGGDWGNTYDYLYIETSSNGHYLYVLVYEGTTNKASSSNSYAFEYDPIDGKFHDVGSSVPATWSIDNTGGNLSAFPTDPNMPIHYFYSSSGSLRIQFENPYYVAPPPVVYEFYVSVEASAIFIWTEISSTTKAISASQITINSELAWNGVVSSVVDGNLNDSSGRLSTEPTSSVDTKLFTLTLPTKISQISITTHRPMYYPGFRIVEDGIVVINDSSNGGSSSQPSPYTRSYTF